MTDNDVIKTLECCNKSQDCSTCLLNEKRGCWYELTYHTLDLINRQKAEIERLRLEVEAVNELINPLPFKSNFDKAIETAKSEAIKEFAERLKKDIPFITLDMVNVNLLSLYRDINNLVKEMTEDENERNR